MLRISNLERRRQKLAPWNQFVARLAKGFAAAVAIIGMALAVGMAGYAYFEGMGAIDAFLNASMILSGMGPVANLVTPGGKIFAGCYALASGFIVLVAAALVVTPIFHRVLHQFHLDDDTPH